MFTPVRSPRRANARPATACDAPAPEGSHVWPPERKLRLFACGCCRQWWDTLAPGCRRAVDLAERYADGNCTVAELGEAWRSCREVERSGLPDAPGTRTTEYVHRVAAAVFTPIDAQTVATDLRPWRGDSGDNTEVDAVCERIYADVLGPAGAALNPSWLTSTVHDLARAMYAAREFSAMPILADALQDAGCDRDDILDHCRDTSRVHVRGCGVVDQILGKA